MVPRHPGPDEKCKAEKLVRAHGGPAATAAVVAARLGCPSAFVGYICDDALGHEHLKELSAEGVYTGYVTRGEMPTTTAAVTVKPDGARSIVFFSGDRKPMTSTPDLKGVHPKVLLFDGREPHISLDLLERAAKWRAQSVLDAGSVHHGTLALESKVDYLVASEKYARQRTHIDHSPDAARALSEFHPNIVVTFGDKGLYYKTSFGEGTLSAYGVPVVDTTGAGDAFHAGFAVGLARGQSLIDTLRFASATAALNCGAIGGRTAAPTLQQVRQLMASQSIG